MNQDVDLKQALSYVIDNQISIMQRQLDVDAQTHALQIVLMSLQPEGTRQRVAEALVQTFDEQRALRTKAFEKALEQLALLRATVSTIVNCMRTTNPGQA